MINSHLRDQRTQYLFFFYAQATISVQANPRGLKRKKKKAAGEGKERLVSE